MRQALYTVSIRASCQGLICNHLYAMHTMRKKYMSVNVRLMQSVNLFYVGKWELLCFALQTLAGNAGVHKNSTVWLEP